MLRGENIVCGTSTTGVGTLTLAATPAAVGALDPFAAFSGIGLGTTNATPMPYIIIEYTDNTYATPSKVEKGFGNLLIGASLAATTLTRNALVTQVSGTYTNGTFSTPATAITIGTAANVLVFIGPSAWDQAQTLHAYSTSGITSADGLGHSPWMVGGSGGSQTLTSGFVLYYAIKLDVSDIHKSCSIRLLTAVTTPTSSSVALALYAVSSTGLPGKMLVNYGNVAGVNPLNATGTLTATAGSGVPIMAGTYILGILPIWVGGTGTPALFATGAVAPSPYGTRFAGFAGPASLAGVSGQTTLNDPATTTSISLQGTALTQQPACAFRNT